MHVATWGLMYSLTTFRMLLHWNFTLDLERDGPNEDVPIPSAELLGAESVDIHEKIIITVLCRSESLKSTC